MSSFYVALRAISTPNRDLMGISTAMVQEMQSIKTKQIPVVHQVFTSSLFDEPSPPSSYA